MMRSLQPCVVRPKALARVVDGDTLDLDKRTTGAWPGQALHPLSHRRRNPLGSLLVNPMAIDTRDRARTQESG
jgi:hypothetical protein